MESGYFSPFELSNPYSKRMVNWRDRPRFTVVPFNFPAGMHRLWWFPSDLNGDCISYELSVLPLDQGTVGACLSRLSPVCPGCIGSPVGVEPTHAKKGDTPQMNIMQFWVITLELSTSKCSPRIR